VEPELLVQQQILPKTSEPDPNYVHELDVLYEVRTGNIVQVMSLGWTWTKER